MSMDIPRLDRDHVFATWTRQRERHPVEIIDGESATLITADDEEIVDMSSQMVCANLGYSASHVVEAMNEQAQLVPYTRSDLATSVRADLGKRLAEITPSGLSKTFFSTSGSEAVEAAIAIARTIKGRKNILARHTSYHGTSLATLSLTGDSRRLSASIEVQGVRRAPDFTSSVLDPDESLAYIDEFLRLEEDIAAVIAEPVVGSSGGVLVPPPDYLAGLKEVAHDNDAFLIADEVMTGFGRTGEWFACDHFDVAPDILTLSKGLTGSYVPLAATVVSSEIAEYYEDEPFMQGYTFSGHPVSCAAGLAAIETYADGVIDRAGEIGKSLRNRLEVLMSEHASVVDVRGLGMFYGVELGGVDSSDQDVLGDVIREAREGGILLFGRNTSLIVAPPLVITEDELDRGLAALDAALDIADSAFA